MFGFYDSAHFTNEFEKFTGKTPKVYKEEISSTESNQIVQEFRQYMSPERLYSTLLKYMTIIYKLKFLKYTIL
jgi:AraC-like DNA-binding protein